MLLVGHLRWDSLGIDHFLKHMDHVEELTVDIANHDNFSFDSHQVWFSFQNVLRSPHYVHQAFLGELAALLQIVLDQLQLDLAVGRRHRQHALETERFNWRRFDALNLPIVARVWQAIAVQYLVTLLSDLRSSLNHIKSFFCNSWWLWWSRCKLSWISLWRDGS